MKLNLLSSIILFLILNKLSYATVVNSAQNGNWETGSTWDIGTVPVCGDTIYVKHVVNVTTNNSTLNGCGNASFIIISGTLDFGNGDKLNLDCGSGITIQAGGLISAAGSGGGASNYIQICGAEVWRKSDGDVTGPSSLGNPLPVELASFQASSEKSYNVIRWTTLSESNSSYFILEKSYDGINFSEFNRIDAQGNSIASHDYIAMDFSPGVSHTFYRLKQVDINNVIRGYNPIKIESKNQIHITLTYTGGNYHISQEQRFNKIKIYGMDGKLLLEESNNDNFYQIPEKVSLPGIFIVITEGEYGRKSQKLAK